MSSVTRIARLTATRNFLKYAENSTSRIRNYIYKEQRHTGLLIHARFQHTETQTNDKDDYHSIIKNTEKTIGESSKHEFQAETRMLLDIVARSLYSEKEVFIRELISNASDALEKFKYIALSESEGQQISDKDRSLEIHISTDKNSRTFTIQDTGIGMTKDELVQNLGIIAKSGSKAFIEQVKQQQATGDNNIIGQFGVGFYSAFMVADKVEVFTRSSKDEHGWKWTSDGTGNYEIQPAEGVSFGTKIILHLKGDCREFADDDTINAIITKYSNFVGSPIYLNGKKANIVQPLWLKDAKSVNNNEHIDFYKFISGSYDVPRYILHYKTDVPLSIAALLYFPEGKPGLFEMSRETESGVALYTKKVLIKNRTDNILPKWLRFVKGVVDSEDIPLNLSRELLQNSNLIRKLRDVLTGRVTKFLIDQLKKDQTEYEKFYQDYGIFIKEGIITNHNQTEKEDAAKLLLFESSHLEPEKKITLSDYITRAKEGRTIFYLAAPSRNLAESSPYYESLKKKQQEVLFCYEPYDELVLMQLQQFQGYKLISVEKDMRDDKAANDLTNLGEDSLKRSEINELSDWLKEKLAGKVMSVNATTRLESHPCVVTVEEMAAARHFIRTQSHGLPEDRRYAILQPQFEINPTHPIIKKMYKLKSSDPELAELLAKQLFANSMVGAGLVEDPRVLLTSMNDLLAKVLDKH
ncbi:heat shock protein 75 kDa, mitochondrial [Euwallacea similis]|uniref:heat shock protein 75 kDa, mitochondrial n=1 Tax=Euwallacea similis TaxID=1736056 RepID=UPI0034504E4A